MTSPTSSSGPAPGAAPHRARFCAGCGAALDDRPAFVQEYWSGTDTNFFCWCRACGATATVVFSDRVVTSEPEH